MVKKERLSLCSAGLTDSNVVKDNDGGEDNDGVEE